jgi:hypothetical protein
VASSASSAAAAEAKAASAAAARARRQRRARGAPHGRAGAGVRAARSAAVRGGAAAPASDGSATHGAMALLTTSCVRAAAAPPPSAAVRAGRRWRRASRGLVAQSAGDVANARARAMCDGAAAALAAPAILFRQHTLQACGQTAAPRVRRQARSWQSRTDKGAATTQKRVRARAPLPHVRRRDHRLSFAAQAQLDWS